MIASGNDRHHTKKPTDPPPWQLVDLGLMDYRRAWALQLDLVAARHEGKSDRDVVLMLEHPAVFTLGRSGGQEYLKVSEDTVAEAGIPVIQVERGGKITYHAPGQLVVYPIVSLARMGLGVADFVTALETVMIRTCAAWGVGAGRKPANRGIWVGERKIGSIGVAVRRGISFHGMALNVDLDLAPFCWVAPCGLEGVSMTSMQRELDKPIRVKQVKASVTEALATVFNASLQPTAEADLPLSAARSAKASDL